MATLKPPEILLPDGPVEFTPFDFKHLAAEDTTYQQQAVREMLDVAAVLVERKREALRLYEPLPLQEAFHASGCRTRLLRGSNRGGKSLPVAVELARAVTGQDPHRKYPDRGTAFIIGDDYDHFGTVIYPMLFERGAFRIVQDYATGMWRSWRPWDASDAARRAETKEAPPLIPKRFVKSISWHMKKDKIPSSVTLRTGWEIHFYSGRGDPPQGMSLDLAWLDEEIPNPVWFPEMSARVVTRNGRVIWSATPQNGTEIFFDLCEKADEQRELPNKTIEQFYIRIADNPHITKAAVAAMADSLSPEDRLIRIEGEFSLAAQRIYHEYSRLVHGIEPFDVPRNWTRYAVIDPGYQVCAVLFAAVPDPDEVPRQDYELLLYDELYIRACSAIKFGKRFGDKAADQHFEEFVIDTRGSRVTEAGSGRTINEQYAEQLKLRGIACRKTGSHFTWGCDMRKPGIERVKSFLDPGPGLLPRLRVMRQRLPNFNWEIERYRFKRIGGQITDEPDEENRPTHLMATLRYLVMANPRFVAAKRQAAAMDPAVAAFLKDRRKGSGPRIHHFGPPARESA